MPEPKTYRFLFSAGGTGGHIFPALAVANQIRKEHPTAEFLFIGAKGKMEMEKVSEAGYKIVGLRISGIQRSSFIKNILWPFKLLGSIATAFSLVRKFKPRVAIGFGGFASGPALYASSMLGVPCLIQEQNSFPGITNRLLAGKVKMICTAYEGMEKFFPAEKIQLLGNPVREEIKNSRLIKEEGVAHFGFSNSLPVVLIFGGSQGALAINRAIQKNLTFQGIENLQFIWQTGPSFFEEAISSINTSGLKNIKVLAFIEEMEKAYSACDLVVCRSGAISISELAVVGKPALFVPLPTAAEDHQTKNAMALVDKGAAIMVTNAEAISALVPAIISLSKDSEKRATMSESIKGFAKPNATTAIVEKIMELAA